MASVLVVAGHPDDEVLGAGGAIARLTREGHSVHVLILGEGATSRGSDNQDAAGSVLELEGCARAAARALGAVGVSFGRLPDNRFDSVDLLRIVRLVEAETSRVAPEMVFTHFWGDLNVDHRLSFEAVMAACRPQPGTSVRAIYSFEVPSATGWAGPGVERVFQPSLYFDISSTLSSKLAALEIYRTEMRAFPHARSLEAVEALARWRGATVGMQAAEAFVVVREQR